MPVSQTSFAPPPCKTCGAVYPLLHAEKCPEYEKTKPRPVTGSTASVPGPAFPSIGEGVKVVKNDRAKIFEAMKELGRRSEKKSVEPAAPQTGHQSPLGMGKK